eukprot:354204-Chlamydomonas_euryale.AAC.2
MPCARRWEEDEPWNWDAHAKRREALRLWRQHAARPLERSRYRAGVAAAAARAAQASEVGVGRGPRETWSVMEAGSFQACKFGEGRGLQSSKRGEGAGLQASKCGEGAGLQANKCGEGGASDQRMWVREASNVSGREREVS